MKFDISIYRPDIDGLRAIAVLSVVLFHVDSGWLPGGFVGVDIFFVISGFLITRNIAELVVKGEFSFHEFYRRRIKRIVPVLTFVIIVTLIVAQFIFTPKDLKYLAYSAAAAQLSAANIFFTYFLDTSYFAADSSLKPLLHLWSLGVEEQFYLFWPLVLVLLLGRVSLHWLICLIAIMAGGSILLGEFLFPTQPIFTYYMLPTRAGQLLAGALCFFAVRAAAEHDPLGSFPREAFAIAGVVLMVGSVLMLTPEHRFPGFNALPVTLGVVLIIFASASGSTMVSRFLSLAPIVWIGLISYSMYLWHWPVLAFAKYVYVDLPMSYKLVAMTVILVLSVFSYNIIEKPLRKSGSSFLTIVRRQFVLPTIAILAMCGGLIGSSGLGVYGFNKSYRASVEKLIPQPPFRSEFVCQTWQVTKETLTASSCVSSDEKEPKVLLWGDSHAAHYVGVMLEIGDEYGFSFRNVAHSACPPVLDQPERFITEHRKTDCRLSGEAVRGELHRYDTVILAGVWGSYMRRENFSQALESTLYSLRTQGKNVILLGQVPRTSSYDTDCVVKALKLPFLTCNLAKSIPRNTVEEINKPLRNMTHDADVAYFDISDVLCDADNCFPNLKDQFVYFDSGHLSIAGSKLIGSIARLLPEARTVFGLLGGHSMDK